VWYKTASSAKTDVLGHYNCAGCAAALGNKKLGLIDHWLRHIRDVKAIHAKELNSLSDFQSRINRLVELKLVSNYEVY
jgi:carbonic anhydrase